MTFIIIYYIYYNYCLLTVYNFSSISSGTSHLSHGSAHCLTNVNVNQCYKWGFNHIFPDRPCVEHDSESLYYISTLLFYLLRVSPHSIIDFFLLFFHIESSMILQVLPLLSSGKSTSLLSPQRFFTPMLLILTVLCEYQ